MSRLFGGLVLVLACALAACSSDPVEPEGGGADTVSDAVGEDTTGGDDVRDPQDTHNDSGGDDARDPQDTDDDGSGGDAGDDADTTPDVVEPPDCVTLTPLRFWNVDPSAIALLFSAEDCETRAAFTGFTQDDFLIEEDGRGLTSEAVPRVLPSSGLRVYVTLLVDMSSSTQSVLSEVQAGASALIEQLLVEQSVQNLYIGIELFDGSAAPATWQRPTRNVDTLLARIDALSAYEGPDVSSTNLHGALRQTIVGQQNYQTEIMERNNDGIVTTGYLVLFTDGGDTAGREDAADASDTVVAARTYDGELLQPTVRTLAVGLRSEDYNGEALSDLVGADALLESDLAQLQETFSEVGQEIARRIAGTYMLAFCSAARAGDHEVTLSVGDRPSNTLGFAFNADGFSGGCSARFFEEICVARECGGFNCGACDDETASCDADSGRCIDDCIAQNQCDGETIINELGYERVCSLSETVTRCGSMCIDTATDEQNCGACSASCVPGEQCLDGNCACPGGGSACDGLCVDTLTDAENCGGCGVTCDVIGSACIDGVCACADGTDVCGALCGFNLATDVDNCGLCGVACEFVGSSCVDGMCECSGDVCEGVCGFDLLTDVANCGQCGFACDPLGSCVNGTCSCPDGSDVCGGACGFNLMTDTANCGECGDACQIAGSTCVQGECRCPECGGDCDACGPDPTCEDGIRNGDEDGVDCGGPTCDACGPDPTCEDGIRNGDEDGVDCGGPTCDACGPDPTCEDGIRNGDEDGVDCGGPTCDACGPDPTCEDGIRNGDEDGVDCGGPTCDACGPDPTCEDGIRNGDEDGVDCGGPTCDACGPDPTCEDGIRNGDEDGVDCGGLVCDAC